MLSSGQKLPVLRGVKMTTSGAAGGETSVKIQYLANILHAFGGCARIIVAPENHGNSVRRHEPTVHSSIPQKTLQLRHLPDSLGAGNYHQPQLPSANMADSDVGTERYSVFMQILSTHFGVWGLYTTKYHVCTYWTPPFDLRIATFAARRWEKNGGMMVIYNTVWW